MSYIGGEIEKEENKYCRFAGRGYPNITMCGEEVHIHLFATVEDFLNLYTFIEMDSLV